MNNSCLDSQTEQAERQLQMLWVWKRGKHPETSSVWVYENVSVQQKYRGGTPDTKKVRNHWPGWVSTGFLCAFVRSPLQLLPSSCRMYPRGQEHWYPPSVFLQMKLQGLGAWMHSSTSTETERGETGTRFDLRARKFLMRSWREPWTVRFLYKIDTGRHVR